MAKPDKSGHAHGREDTLSTEQLTAIDLLATGQTDQDVAERVGRTRQTVCNWRNYHPRFQSELNRRRHELWASVTDRFRALLPKALTVLERELDTPREGASGGDHCVKAAVAVVKMAGLPLHSIGAQDPDAIVRAELKRREEAERAEIFRFGPSMDEVRADLLAKAQAGDAIESDGADVK